MIEISMATKQALSLGGGGATIRRRQSCLMGKKRKAAIKWGEAVECK